MRSIDPRHPRLIHWVDILRGPENKKRLAMLEEDWPQAFKDHILPILPVDEVARHFSPNSGRPTKDIRTMMGLFALQELNDWTDKEAQRALCHDNSVRFALDVPVGTDQSLYVCRKSLHNFRTVIKENNLSDLIFNKSTMELVKRHNVDCSHQRMDSVHITTNIKKLSRLGVMSGTVKKFLKAFRRLDAAGFKALDKGLVDRYLREDKSGFDYFGQVKPSQRDQAMMTVARDIFELVTRFGSVPEVAGMAEFGLLDRVCREQCRVGVKERIDAGTDVALRDDDEVDPSAVDSDGLEEPEDGDADPEGGSGERVLLGLKPAKEVGIDSLQSPADPDAGYSAHKGKGMQVQLVETCSPGPAADGDDPRLRLVLYRKVQKANEQDAAALIPALDDLASRDLAPDVLSADTSYGGDANHAYAASMGVELLAPASGKVRGRKDGKPPVEPDAYDAARDEAQSASFAMEQAGWVEVSEDEPPDGPRGPVRLADFHSNGGGVIEACPAGQRAETRRNQSGTGGRAEFDRAVCMRCGLCGTCPVTMTRKAAWLTYKDVDVRLDKRRAYEETEEFKTRYRQRSGIEATNSELAKTSGFKELRVRGIVNADYRATFKVIALNARRVIKFVMRKTRGDGPRNCPGNVVRKIPNPMGRRMGDQENEGIQSTVAL